MRAGSGGFEKDSVQFYEGGEWEPDVTNPSSREQQCRSAKVCAVLFPEHCDPNAAPHGGVLEDGFSFQERDTVVKSQRNRHPLILFIYLNARGTQE